ncbi:MAG: gliding motility protein GldN [Bacteroidetes bacterium]|nr:gliding motility protein GldN [Bacteroidota bacterium]
MRKGIIILFVLIALSFQNSIQAQSPAYETPGAFPKQAVAERKIVPWPYLREADVMYSRRIERVIDTREKINLCMKWPKNPLYDLIYKAVTEKATLVAYKSDSLTSFYTAEEVLKLGSYDKNIQVYPDPNDPYYAIDSVIPVRFKPEEIRKYKLIEEWIFDRNTSEMYVRILAIAPMYRPVAGSTGIELPEQEMFYIKYNDARPLFVNEELFNRFNDAGRLTVDDFFEQRLFNSYITKESNDYDLAIRQFEEFKVDPYESLLKGEEIKNKLFEFEHDLWEF